MRQAGGVQAERVKPSSACADAACSTRGACGSQEILPEARGWVREASDRESDFYCSGQVMIPVSLLSPTFFGLHLFYFFQGYFFFAKKIQDTHRENPFFRVRLGLELG